MKSSPLSFAGCPSLALWQLAPLAFVAAATSGCSSPSASPTSNAVDAAPAPVETVDAAPAVSGTNCSEVTTQISTCQATTLCPGLQVDLTQYPGCGFEVHGNAVDLECLCYGQLCSMGVTATCDDAAGLLSGGAVLATVCAQTTTNRCNNLGAIGGTSAGCQNCVNSCGGDPVCIANCGC